MLLGENNQPVYICRGLLPLYYTEKTKMTILVTGGAGFIGSHLCYRLLQLKHTIIIIDNFDPFYDIRIKKENISGLLENPSVTFIEADITDDSCYEKLNPYKIDCIIHLAAKAGVRPSIENAPAYQNTNVKGTLNLLEYAKQKNIGQFIFASSSSVYGVNPDFPWNEENSRLMPISPYAATKLAGEHLGFTYAHLYDIQFTALRFFTVFGPGQRPDLAIHKFFHALYNNKPIQVFGKGDTLRDYTFIDDIISGITGALVFKGKEKFNVFNLGGNEPVKLLDLIAAIEKVCNRQFDIQYQEMQPGDVPVTFASIDKAAAQLGYSVSTKLEAGLQKFKIWYEAIVMLHGE